MSTQSGDEGEAQEMVDIVAVEATTTTIETIILNGKRVPRDVALQRCVAQVEAGSGHWKCTNVLGRASC